MASKMAEISNTQEQYYLNYLQQKANNEREDTIRQEGYDREDAIRQEGYNRADTAESFTDFIDNISEKKAGTILLTVDLRKSRMKTGLLHIN